MAFHRLACGFQHNPQLPNYAIESSRMLMKLIYRMHQEPTHGDIAIIESMWFDVATQTRSQKADYQRMALDLERFCATSLCDFKHPKIDESLRSTLAQELDIQLPERAAYFYCLISKEECNAFGLYTYRYKGSHQPRQSFGIALFPTAIFFNHSCDPNVGRMYNRDGDMEYFALRPIRAGEQ
ncbi:hypothetical protein HDU91_007059, partial [Kappamyces sp. JEL0680]